MGLSRRDLAPFDSLGLSECITFTLQQPGAARVHIIDPVAAWAFSVSFLIFNEIMRPGRQAWSNPSYKMSFQYYSCLFLHGIGFSNVLYLGFDCICFCFGLSKAFQRVNLTEAFALLICRYYFLNGMKYFLRLLVQIFLVRTGAYVYLYVHTYQNDRILLSL